MVPALTGGLLIRRGALAAALAFATALLPPVAGAQAPTVMPRAGIRVATPDEVAKRIREEEEMIKVEPPVAGLSRPVSYYLRTRSCPGSGGKQRWRILPVGEVPDQPAAWQGGHRRNTPWGSVSGSPRERMRTSLSR